MKSKQQNKITKILPLVMTKCTVRPRLSGVLSANNMATNIEYIILFNVSA